MLLYFMSAFAALLHATQPTVSEGTCIAVYHQESTATYLLVGVDVSSGAMVFSSSMLDESTLRTANGNTYRVRTGESEFAPYPDDRVRTAIQLCEHFPFLTLPALKQIDPARLEISTMPDGSATYTARLVIGNLGLTAQGYEHPGGSRDAIVRYSFDSTGRLTTIDREENPTQIIEYADARHPVLAPALPRNYNEPSGMQVVSVETYIPGRPDLFEPDVMLARIQRLTQQHAEEEQALVAATLATEGGQEQMRESQEPDNGIFGWRSNRVALILTGLIVIAVGSLAWWKNRS